MQSVEIYSTSMADVHCLIYVDVKQGTIHVLDVNNEGTTSVTNGIEQIQEQIIKQHNLSGSVADWKWFLYGTDGVASVYEHGEFHVAPTDLLNEKYALMMEKIAQQE